MADNSNSDCFAAIMRTYYTWQLTDSSDVSWNISLMSMWTWIEMSFGILVASLPVTPRFYQFFKQRSSMLMTTSRRRVSQFTETRNTKGNSKVASTVVTSPIHAKGSDTGPYYELDSPRKAAFPHQIREVSVFDDRQSSDNYKS